MRNLLEKPLALVLWAVIIGSITPLIAVSTAGAHGAGVQLNKREFAGPYEVALGVVPDPPVVGEMALTLAVIEMRPRTVVTGADVTLTARGPGPTVIGPLTVAPDPADPAFYDLRMALEAAGTWVFTVEVAAPQGVGSADFTVEVKKSSPVTGIITLLTLLAFVVILGLSVRAFLSGRGRTRTRGRRG